MTTHSPAAPSEAKPPRSVADLAREVDELRALITELTARVAALTPATSATEAAPVAAPAAPPSAAAASEAPSALIGGPESDPISAMRAVLTAAFTMAQEPIPSDPDEADAQFERFSQLIHSERRGTPLLEQSLRNYTWQQLRRNVRIYLDEQGAPGSFETTRVTPDPVTPHTQQAKVFVRAQTRMPTPVTFRRDRAAGGAWRIEASSL